MKLTVDHDLLAGAVTQVARSVPQRPAVPVLAGMRVAAGEGGAEISAFDYEVSSIENLPADVAQPGTSIVPGRLLAEIVRSMPAKPVELDTGGSRMRMNCAAARFTLPLLPEDEYPALPAMPPAAGKAGGAALAGAVAQTAIAASRDDTLPALASVLFEIRGRKITLIATDRYRMAFRELDWDPVSDGITADALIPARVLQEVARRAAAAAETAFHLGDSDGDGDGARIAGFTAGSSQATIRLTAAEYPDMRKRIPAEFSDAAEVPREEFISAIRRVALVAAKNTPVRVTFAKGKVSLEAGAGDEAQGREELDAEFGGAEFRIAFNPVFLADGIDAAGGDTVRISLTAPGRPAMITPAGDQARVYRYVLMPVRSAG